MNKELMNQENLQACLMNNSRYCKSYFLSGIMNKKFSNGFTLSGLRLLINYVWLQNAQVVNILQN